MKPSDRVVTPLERDVDDYLVSRRAQGVSPLTINNYGYALRNVFVPWATARGIERVENLTSRHLEQFSAQLMDVGGVKGRLSPHTVWSYMKATKLFLAWSETSSARVPMPKLPQHLVDILTPHEMQRLEDAATTERDKIIVRLLADTGVRRGELIQLTVRDLSEEAGRWYIKVHGKGARDRKVPVRPELARRIRRYIHGRPANVDSDRLFLALRTRPGGTVYEPLTESGATQLVKALGRRTGLTKKVTPHVFRHTAATLMLRRGVNPLLVAQVLGHSGLQMLTKVYSHLTPTDAHRALMDALRASNDE